MKTTAIPAQVTTVEDKIAGNLSMTQIILLLVPLFASIFIYALLPERLHFTPYKIGLIFLVLVAFLTLAVRVKERIILTWLILLVSYHLRPHVFVFDKNDPYLRENPLLKENEHKNLIAKEQTKKKEEGRSKLSIRNLILLESLISSRNTKMAIKFSHKRGLLSNRL